MASDQLQFFHEDKNREEFSTLFNICRGDIEYSSVQLIATKLRKPDMKLISNILAVSPRERKLQLSQSPRQKEQSPSPRTKIQNLLGQNDQSYQSVRKESTSTTTQNIHQDPFRMSRTKLNFNKKEFDQRQAQPRGVVNNSPRNRIEEEKSTSSFFRRIFCLSPKVASPRLENKSPRQNQVGGILTQQELDLLKENIDIIDDLKLRERQREERRLRQLKIEAMEKQKRMIKSKMKSQSGGVFVNGKQFHCLQCAIKAQQKNTSKPEMLIKEDGVSRLECENQGDEDHPCQQKQSTILQNQILSLSFRQEDQQLCKSSSTNQLIFRLLPTELIDGQDNLESKVRLSMNKSVDEIQSQKLIMIDKIISQRDIQSDEKNGQGKTRGINLNSTEIQREESFENDNQSSKDSQSTSRYTQPIQSKSKSKSNKNQNQIPQQQNDAMSNLQNLKNSFEVVKEKIKRIKLKEKVTITTRNDEDHKLNTSVQIKEQAAPKEILQLQKVKHQTLQPLKQSPKQFSRANLPVNLKDGQTFVLGKSKHKLRNFEHSLNGSFAQQPYQTYDQELNSYQLPLTEKRNQNLSFSTASQNSRNLLTKGVVKPLYSQFQKNANSFDPYDLNFSKMIKASVQNRDYSSVLKQRENYVSSQRAHSLSVEPSAKLERLKIQKILDEQKAAKQSSLVKAVSKLESHLFHFTPLKQRGSTLTSRSKSVLKTTTEIGLPYKNSKHLPQITQRLNRSNANCGTESVLSAAQTDQNSELIQFLDKNNNTNTYTNQSFSVSNYQQTPSKVPSDGHDIFNSIDLTEKQAKREIDKQKKQHQMIYTQENSNLTSIQQSPRPIVEGTKNNQKLSLEEELKTKLESLKASLASQYAPTRKGASLIQGRLDAHADLKTNDTINSNTASKVFVSAVNLMSKLSLFKKIHKTSIKSLISSICTFMFLQKGQILYKEEDEQRYFFLVVYGELSVWSRRTGVIGKIQSGGFVGEESMMDLNFICRLESCNAEQDSCVLCIKREDYIKFKVKSIDSNSNSSQSFIFEDITREENKVVEQDEQEGGSSGQVAVTVQAQKDQMKLDLITFERQIERSYKAKQEWRTGTSVKKRL